jgi:hypothetical protein
MQLFVLTNHCTCRRHCKTCRNLEEGRSWRQGLQKFFTLPKNEVDFSCPYGIPWAGNVTPNKIIGTPAPKPMLNPVPKATTSSCAPCQRKKKNV